MCKYEFSIYFEKVILSIINSSVATVSTTGQAEIIPHITTHSI